MTLCDGAVLLEYCLSLDLSTLLLSARDELHLALSSGWRWLLVALQSRLLRATHLQDLYTDSIPVRLGHQINIYIN
jgi:hypothetical protein